MRLDPVCIEAVAHVLPDVSVTTASIERMLARLYGRLGLGAGFLEGLTGIRARGFWEDGTQPSDVATKAAEKALRASGIDRSRIGALVSTSVCRDYDEPSVASLVHGNLGLPSRCLNFDVGNACLGFLSGINTVASLVRTGDIEAGLVVAGEGSRVVTQSTVQRLLKPDVDFNAFKDNLATLTLGSAAAAMVVAHERVCRQGHPLLGSVSLAATEHSRLCVGSRTYMKTDPARLLSEGVKLAGRTWAAAQEELGIGVDDVKEFAMHQVGKANHDAVLGALGLPSERSLRLYPDWGNVGAAGVPLTLARTVEAGRVGAGDLVALMGIGSGLNCTVMAVRW